MRRSAGRPPSATSTIPPGAGRGCCEWRRPSAPAISTPFAAASRHAARWARDRAWTSATRTRPRRSSLTDQIRRPSRTRCATTSRTARPGSRAPHLWIEDGRSTLDLFGGGMVVISGADGEAWVRAARQIANGTRWPPTPSRHRVAARSCTGSSPTAPSSYGPMASWRGGPARRGPIRRRPCATDWRRRCGDDGQRRDRRGGRRTRPRRAGRPKELPWRPVAARCGRPPVGTNAERPQQLPCKRGTTRSSPLARPEGDLVQALARLHTARRPHRIVQVSCGTLAPATSPLELVIVGP